MLQSSQCKLFCQLCPQLLPCIFLLLMTWLEIRPLLHGCNSRDRSGGLLLPAYPRTSAAEPFPMSGVLHLGTVSCAMCKNAPWEELLIASPTNQPSINYAHHNIIEPSSGAVIKWISSYLCFHVPARTHLTESVALIDLKAEMEDASPSMYHLCRTLQWALSLQNSYSMIISADGQYRRTNWH